MWLWCISSVSIKSRLTSNFKWLAAALLWHLHYHAVKWQTMIIVKLRFVVKHFWASEKLTFHSMCTLLCTPSNSVAEPFLNHENVLPFGNDLSWTFAATRDIGERIVAICKTISLLRLRKLSLHLHPLKRWNNFNAKHIYTCTYTSTYMRKHTRTFAVKRGS